MSSNIPTDVTTHVAQASNVVTFNKPVVSTSEKAKSELLASSAQQAIKVKESQETRENEELAEAVGNVRSFVQSIQRDLDFVVDEETGKDVIKVIDQQTNEIIRQFPAEAILSLAKNLQKVAGLLLKTEV